MIPACEVTPEHRLWMAVIGNAVNDLHEKKHADAAKRWFASDRTSVGSFRWICSHIGVDPATAARMVGEKCKTKSTRPRAAPKP